MGKNQAVVAERISSTPPHPRWGSSRSTGRGSTCASPTSAGSR
jgi:hypothetical protein